MPYCQTRPQEVMSLWRAVCVGQLADPPIAGQKATTNDPTKAAGPQVHYGALAAVPSRTPIITCLPCGRLIPRSTCCTSLKTCSRAMIVHGHTVELARAGRAVRLRSLDRARPPSPHTLRPERCPGATKEAARAAGHAVAVAHMADHELGAAAYAIRAVRAAASEDRRRRGWPPGVSVAACPASRRDPRTCARRPEVAQQEVLVLIRLLTGGLRPL